MQNSKIAVIGLGYVGLPLACLFATRYRVVGFDINQQRVNQINHGYDDADELPASKLNAALGNGMIITNDSSALDDCNVFIVAVPTPVDKDNTPLLTPLEGASRTVGEHIHPGAYVIYESTVYPGTTEEVCVPVIEKYSGLVFNKDFYVGYSPERINPGDKEHTVENILKITSGSTPEAADFIDRLYKSVLINGTYRAPSIQVAEAAKVIENSQRDVNIAFINEISKIFNVLGINTNEVINAAATKWNFLPFHPGLVGGHCIGVDPYYLIQRALNKGYRPNLMIEARHINDTMGQYVASRVTNELTRRGVMVRESSILILGFAFKENCRDMRNTKVEDVYHSMCSYTPNVIIFDPVIDCSVAKREYNIDVEGDVTKVNGRKFDAIIQCVNHEEFRYLDRESMLNPEGFIFYINEPKKHLEGSYTEIAM